MTCTVTVPVLFHFLTMSCCARSLEFPPVPSDTLPTPLCCTAWNRKCQKLRVVVITTKLWETRPVMPGFVLPWTVSPGIVGDVRIGGPGAYPSAYVPSYLNSVFPVGKKTALVYDFGSTPSGVSSAKIMASSPGGCADASLQFTYSWCGSADCNGEYQPRFVVEKCTFNGLKFYVLDGESYISTDPCTESVVVLALQQYCPDPLEPYESCDGSLDGCDWKRLPCGAFGKPGCTRV